MPAATDLRLDGKTALVTGASRGIGESIARTFARAGATVVLSSRRQESLDQLADSIREDGGQALPMACHTGDGAAIADLFDRLRGELPGLDILVNNAATNPFFGPVLEVPEAAFDKTLEVNLKGYFLISQHAGRWMAERGSGSILNVASILGLSAAPLQVVYSMTKAAVISLTQGMAKELGPKGIRVNAIAPGLVETRFAAALIDDEKLHRSILQGTPLRRHGQPREISGLALFLASEAASYITGAVMVADGGATA